MRHSGEEHGGDVHEKYSKSVSRRQGGHENDHSGLPPYIQEGTLEAKRWHDRHPDNNRVRKIVLQKFQLIQVIGQCLHFVIFILHCSLLK